MVCNLQGMREHLARIARRDRMAAKAGGHLQGMRYLQNMQLRRGVCVHRLFWPKMVDETVRTSLTEYASTYRVCTLIEYADAWHGPGKVVWVVCCGTAKLTKYAAYPVNAPHILLSSTESGGSERSCTLFSNLFKLVRNLDQARLQGILSQAGYCRGRELKYFDKGKKNFLVSRVFNSTISSDDFDLGHANPTLNALYSPFCAVLRRSLTSGPHLLYLIPCCAFGRTGCNLLKADDRVCATGGKCDQSLRECDGTIFSPRYVFGLLIARKIC